jgi:hypothetical protein
LKHFIVIDTNVVREAHVKRLLFAVSLVAGIATVEACGIAFRDPRSPVTLSGEQAIIIWDPAKKEEHFIRQASFEGADEDFGFIVPTPSMPEVSKSDQKAFVVMYTMNDRPSRGVGGPGMEGAASGGQGGGSVTVLQEYQVGDYQAAIVKATDGKTMAAWLKKNGYMSRPALEEWLETYTKKQWFFAALKLTRAPGASTDRTSAVRVSFKTDVPHYPYKMPADTWPQGHVRPLTLYFITTGDVDARYAGTQTEWEATSWSSQELGAGRISLAQSVGISENEIPSGARYTTFTNSTNQHGYDHDLEFHVGPKSQTLSAAFQWLESLT